MTPPTPLRERKAPVHFTEDMKRRIASEWQRARKLEKSALRAKYNVTGSTVTGWIRRGLANGPTPRLYRERKDSGLKNGKRAAAVMELARSLVELSPDDRALVLLIAEELS